MLDADEGARYIGEFAIGFNPYVTEPMLDILFDEKIAGSFHFTPGKAYEEADNGNTSTIHWDIVCLQDEANGGGEIWFDGTLIRKNGRRTRRDLASGFKAGVDNDEIVSWNRGIAFPIRFRREQDEQPRRM